MDCVFLVEQWETSDQNEGLNFTPKARGRQLTFPDPILFGFLLEQTAQWRTPYSALLQFAAQWRMVCSALLQFAA
jgi:hypothetical protein